MAATPEDVFRYVFLLSNASITLLVNQSRQQAESAFRLSFRVAVAGFVLLAAGILIGLVSQLNEEPLSTAYLAGAVGVLTEFISGVFFWMYNRTLQQISLFYGGLMEQQNRALAEIARDAQRAEKQPIISTDADPVESQNE
jgi:hypothetical protein